VPRNKDEEFDQVIKLVAELEAWFVKNHSPPEIAVSAMVGIIANILVIKAADLDGLLDGIKLTTTGLRSVATTLWTDRHE
jgi:hypothetical protein